MKKSLTFNKKQKDIVNVFIYIAFIGMMVKWIIDADQMAVKITYTCILLIFGSVVIYYEYLKKLNERAILTLIEKCDPYQGMHLIHKLERLDLFKSFKQAILIYRLLALRDQGKYDETLRMLRTLGKKHFSSSYDLLLIYHHSLFQAYCAMQNSQQAEIAYQDVMALQHKKKGLKKITPLFAWDEVSSMYYYTIGRYRESHKYLKQVSTDHMNKREQIHYHMLAGRLALAKKQIKDARKSFKEVLVRNNQMAVSEEAKNILKKI